jgi:hypothetical protein
MSTVRFELPISRVLTCGPKFHKDNEFIIKWPTLPCTKRAEIIRYQSPRAM